MKNEAPSSSHSRRSLSHTVKQLIRLVSIFAGFALMANIYLVAQEGDGGAQSSPNPARELSLKITAPFTVATVGDIIEPQPITDQIEPEYQALIKVIHDSDVGFANMESSLVDMNHRDEFPGSISGTLAPLEVGADIKAMGFTMMNRANNHALDGTQAGMISTDDALDKLGIVHAGSGRNLNEARAARFLDTPKGRVGLVGMYSIDTSITENGEQYMYMGATYRVGDTGGRPGVDPLRLTTYHVVTPEQLQSLRAIRTAYVTSAATNTETDRLQLFDDYYKTGTAPGSLSYQMNPDDEREILRSIRNGKNSADLLIATIHAHHGAQNIQGVRTVSDFLLKLAHDCIDNGADMFVTHGPHELQGVEIYKGKPIFYGLSAFVFQSDLQLSSSQKQILDAPRDERPNCCALGNPEGEEGMVATSHFEGGRLVEIRLYPVDLGLGNQRPMSRMGIPMTPTPEIAQRILTEMQELSKPFGTKIEIKDNIGIIRVTP
jgi:poly-gamma-glutamate synthesis protein (capsule biosynthesis protein)